MASSVPRTTLHRYYSLHYAPGAAKRAVDKMNGGPAAADGQVEGAKNLDVCVARHHNGLCVICISPEHPVAKGGVSNVEYVRPLKAVSGKRKRGGSFAVGDTNLCRITGGDGAVYMVKCAIKGTILEYNENLRENPNLVTKDPITDGYLAVILPPVSELLTAVNHLITPP